MAKLAVLRYGCRRCGVVFDRETCPPVKVIRWLKDIMRTSTRTGVFTTEIHDCPDGGYGVVELIGADIRDEEA